MEEKEPKFIVIEHPPWYGTSDRKDVFNCASTRGLLDTVAELMMLKQEELSEREKKYKPKTNYKTIRNMVIRDADTIQQKPSRSLLLALMDLVHIEAVHECESMASIDKAGLKHVLLACGNYTMFYIPNRDLISGNDKKVIPVVTQYSDTHNFLPYDTSRSMVGTYTVDIPTTGNVNGKSYFVQEVLFVPGLKSLELLKEVAGNRFEFWDMALEMPTHFTALAPSFQQIQSSQLLRTKDNNDCTQSKNEALASHMEDIRPMCCVLGRASAELLKKKRDSSVDCFTETQVICDLKNFHYANGGTRTVYFRRNGKLLDGKRVNLVPVVTLRKGQAQAPELYVSTTVRFCRAVKHCCVKGNREHVGCWNDTLMEFARDTFITGANMYQEIHYPALTAFIKRVNPNSWCAHIPKHVETMIKNPVMVEVVELAIRFMASKIPNAFPVAELLYCPIEKVHKYLKMWNMYSSDDTVHMAVRKARIGLVEGQMRKDWAALTRIISSYGQKRYQKAGDLKMASACEELCKVQTLDNVAKAQKMWQALVKHDASKIKDKELIQLHANAKVLFLKLRTYHNELKKGLKVERVHCDAGSASSSPHSTDSQDSVKCSAKAEEESEDAAAWAKTEEGSEDTAAGVGEKDDSLYSIVIPESVPISTWIKNMSTLLLSEPWLNDEPLRREAVCTLLGLDDTLLDRKHSAILREWVIDNRTVVNIIRCYGLQDRLSKALVDCLEYTSTDSWRRKVLSSFQGTRDRSRGLSNQQPCHSMNPCAQSPKNYLLSKGGSGCAKKQAPCGHPEKMKRARSAPKPTASRPSWKARSSREHSPLRRYLDDEAQPWLDDVEEETEEEEEDCQENEESHGEEDYYDLLTMDDYDYESPDDYDYNDEFIDDGPIEEGYSSKEEEEDKEAVRARFTSRSKKATCKTKNVGRRKYERVLHSESEEDEYSPKPVCSGVKEVIRGYKRALQSDSDEELNKPDVKSVKRTKANPRPDRSVDSSDDRTCAKMKKKDKPDMRREGFKPAKNTISYHQDSPPIHKSKLWDSDDYEREENPWGGIKGVNSSKRKFTRSPISDTDTEQEESGQRRETKKSRPDDTPRREPDSRTSPPSQYRSPGGSQSEERRSSGQSANVAKLSGRIVRHTNTTEPDTSDQEGNGGCDRKDERLTREERWDHLAGARSAAVSEEEEDSDIDTDIVTLH